MAPGPGSLTVSWNAPEEDGGAPLLGYAVEYSISNIVYLRWPRPDALTAATTVTIDGLTGDQLHYVRVGAVGCAGRSLWTPPTAAAPTVAPTATPAAPPTPTVRPGPGRFTVTWTAPDNDGGAPIHGYLLEYSTDGGATWTPQHHTAATTTITATIRGLTGGHPHQVRVRAANGAGAGEPSTVVGAEPSAAAPDRPAAPTGTPGAGTLTVTWTAPHHNGAPITGYTIEYSTDQGRTWTPWPHTTTATQNGHHRPHQRATSPDTHHRHQHRRHRPTLTHPQRHPPLTPRAGGGRPRVTSLRRPPRPFRHRRRHADPSHRPRRQLSNPGYVTGRSSRVGRRFPT